MGVCDDGAGARGGGDEGAGGRAEAEAGIFTQRRAWQTRCGSERVCSSSRLRELRWVNNTVVHRLLSLNTAFFKSELKNALTVSTTRRRPGGCRRPAERGRKACLARRKWTRRRRGCTRADRPGVPCLQPAHLVAWRPLAAAAGDAGSLGRAPRNPSGIPEEVAVWELWPLSPPAGRPRVSSAYIAVPTIVLPMFGARRRALAPIRHLRPADAGVCASRSGGGASDSKTLPEYSAASAGEYMEV